MQRRYRWIIILLLLGTVLFGEQVPRVGLVLSGGGAKGIAHVGVLKVLEKHGIQPDYITGTSMGSIIGALYSLGYSADELEEMLLEQDWDEILLDKVPRNSRSLEEKEDDARYFLSFPIRKYNITLPKGLVAGQNVSQLLTRLMVSAHGTSDFSELPIPFLCIGTDIETGEAVVLDSGFLPEAVRASMSIPSMFTPIEYDGKLLVDGGLVRNFPVSDCLDMGADFIIGVDVAKGLQTRDQLNSLVAVMEQSISFQGAYSTRAERQLTDILITPEVSEYAITDFSSADTLIALGETAALAVEEQLQELTEKLPNPCIYPSQERLPETFLITRISVNGLKNVSKNLIIGKMPLSEGESYSIEEIDAAITKIYGSSYFERVNYKLIQINGDYELNIDVVEKNTSVFRFGLHYDSDMKAAILLNTTWRNLLIQGSKMSIDAKLGENRTFHFKEFIHTGWKPGFGVGLEIIYDRFSFDYRNAQGEKLARFNIENDAVILDLKTIFSDHLVLGGNLDFRTVRTAGDIVPTEWQDIDYESYWVRSAGYFELDSRNRSVFATKGTHLFLEIKQFYGSTDSTSIDTQFLRYFFQGEQNFPIHQRLALSLGGFAGATTTEDVPQEEAFYLGGFTDKDNGRPFAGLNFAEVIAEEAYILRFKLQYQPFEPAYIILRLDTGRVVRSFEGFASEDFIMHGWALSAAIDSPIGPLDISIMNNNQHSQDDLRYYINIGYSF